MYIETIRATLQVDHFSSLPNCGSEHGMTLLEE
jgi:hypothetical protein